MSNRRKAKGMQGNQGKPEQDRQGKPMFGHLIEGGYTVQPGDDLVTFIAMGNDDNDDDTEVLFLLGTTEQRQQFVDMAIDHARATGNLIVIDDAAIPEAGERLRRISE